MTRQHDIGFDEAVIACSAYLLRGNGHRILDVVREMIQAYGPDTRRGTVGDLGVLKQYGLLEEPAQPSTKGARPVHTLMKDEGARRESLCGRYISHATPVTTNASEVTCKHCLKKLSKEGKL